MATAGHTLINDPLLDFVLENSVLSTSRWIRYERRNVDRNVFLRLLAILACVSKSTRLCAGFTVQLAALRLASHDVEFGSERCVGVPKALAVLKLFDVNVDIFSKSW